ncbi:unnamed protein product [Laminaria digitata]
MGSNSSSTASKRAMLGVRYRVIFPSSGSASMSWNTAPHSSWSTTNSFPAFIRPSTFVFIPWKG